MNKKQEERPKVVSIVEAREKREQKEYAEAAKWVVKRAKELNW